MRTFFAVVAVSLAFVQAQGSPLRSVPFDKPLRKIPAQFLLDTAYISSVEFQTASTTCDWLKGMSEPVLLCENLEWITDSTADPVPTTLDSVVSAADRMGFRLLELTDLQAKAAQVLVANGAYLLILVQPLLGTKRLKKAENQPDESIRMVHDTTFTPARDHWRLQDAARNPDPH